MDRPVRADKWLWASRLLKTRALAAEALRGGRVHVNGQAAKPSKELKPGDRLEVTTGELRREVVILATAEKRGPASEAVKLYEETPESVAAREAWLEQRRLAPPPVPEAGGRPTKKDRRRLERTFGGRPVWKD